MASKVHTNVMPHEDKKCKLTSYRPYVIGSSQKQMFIQVIKIDFTLWYDWFFRIFFNLIACN
jgi:hypothetical protein